MEKTAIKIIIVCILFTPAANANADILKTPPEHPSPPARLLIFYLHGQIVEGSNGCPGSPEYGQYQYDDILEAFSKKGFLAISEISP